MRLQKIRYRLAKKTDSKMLAFLHWQASLKQPNGFMHKLGISFLVRYYKYIIEEKNSVILCAIDENEAIVGFVSGSLDNNERINTFHKKRIVLFFSIIPQIIKRPKLLKEIISRYFSDSAENNNGYIVKEGPHEDYWAWKDDINKSNAAILLHIKWLEIMKSLGIDSIKGEVDNSNKFILKIHLILGAKIVKEYFTPDHRERVIIEYKLIK